MPENLVPILYLADLAERIYNPADIFDLAFLLRSPERYDLRGVVLPEGRGGERAVNTLAARADRASIPFVYGAAGIAELLAASPEPVNVVAVGNFAPLAELLAADRALIRQKVGRLFLVGGHANDYRVHRTEGERLPIDPRLKERHPERFAPEGEPRLREDGERKAFATLLTSGEGVIFLPRDICLWRYAAPQVLADGGTVCEFALRELFYANLETAGENADRFACADAPVLLSALPAFLLATQPDPMGWLRLFRAVTARVETDEEGRVATVAVKHERPNLYAVVGIDGRGLGELLTKTLRVRPFGVT